VKIVKKSNYLGLNLPEGTDKVDYQTFFTDNYNKIDSSLADIATNVKSFGAKGDGITDDTTAIQNAINSLTNGGRILFPAGTYLISKSVSNYVLTLNSNIELQGKKGKTIFKLNSGSGTVYMMGNGSYTENIKITNIIFDGNYPTVNATSSPLFFPNIKNIVSQENIYKNFGGQGTNYGDTVLAQDITHERDYFDTIVGTGILTHNNKNIKVKDCHFNNVKDSNINVTAQTVEDIETFILLSGNVSICPSDFVSGHSVFSIMGDNSQVVNNKIQGGAVQIVIHAGPFAKNSRNYLIQGNILEDGGQGITVNQDVNAKIIISNNFIKNPTSSGIELTGWDGSATLQGQCVVSDNIIEGSGSSTYTQYQIPMSIKVSGLVNGIIKGNIITNPNYAGIGLIRNNKRILIYGNSIDGHIGKAPTDSLNHYGGGIYIDKYAMTVTQRNIIIDSNLISNFMTGVASPAAGGVYGAGIVVVGDSANLGFMKQISIKNNFIETGSGNGISITNTTDAKIVNNSVWATGQAALNTTNNTTPYVTNAVI
jgi:hypothetical protein